MQIQPQLSGLLLQILYFVTITQLFVEPKTLPLSFFRAHSEYAFREQLRYQLKEVRRKFSTFASFGLSPKGFPDSQYFCKFVIAILNHWRKEYVGIFILQNQPIWVDHQKGTTLKNRVTELICYRSWIPRPNRGYKIFGSSKDRKIWRIFFLCLLMYDLSMAN